MRMKDQRSKNNEIALIAMSVAMIIGGGIGIYMISAVLPIPEIGRASCRERV